MAARRGDVQRQVVGRGRRDPRSDALDAGEAHAPRRRAHRRGGAEPGPDARHCPLHDRRPSAGHRPDEAGRRVGLQGGGLRQPDGGARRARPRHRFERNGRRLDRLAAARVGRDEPVVRRRRCRSPGRGRERREREHAPHPRQSRSDSPRVGRLLGWVRDGAPFREQLARDRDRHRRAGRALRSPPEQPARRALRAELDRGRRGDERGMLVREPRPRDERAARRVGPRRGWPIIPRRRDGHVMRGGCNQPCDPPLPQGLIGAYTSIAHAADGTVWVAGYNDAAVDPTNGLDSLYGDLVVGKFDTASSTVKWVTVDGLPGPLADGVCPPPTRRVGAAGSKTRGRTSACGRASSSTRAATRW